MKVSAQIPAPSQMLLDLLREIEDQNTKLGGCLERGDSGQAQVHHAAIRRLVLETAVVVLRVEDRPIR